MIKQALSQVLEGRDLPREDARAAMDDVMRGEATAAQIAGFLVALRVKGETPEEITGFAQAMRAHLVPVHSRRADLVDTAGTGGDGSHTVNLSTAAALVAAAAGIPIAKHGNRAVSSSCGSADVLEALGFDLDMDPETIAESIDELGFGFLFAPLHHPAMRHAAPVRKELATRTVFNILGPLTNPAGARAQLLGVYSAELVPTIAEVLVRLGARRALVVHGHGGLDELSTMGPNLLLEVLEGKIVERTFDPIDLGIATASAEDLRGGTPKENADAIRMVLSGERGPKRDAVLLNAAGAIYVGNGVRDLAEAFEVATGAVDSGAARERLERLVAFSGRDGDETAVMAS